MCNADDIGDEFHLLMNCKFVTVVEIRKQFLSTLSEITPQIDQLSNECKFVYIFSFIERTFFQPEHPGYVWLCNSF